MKRSWIYIGLILLSVFPVNGRAQSSMEMALDEIEQNNSVLKALKDAAEAAAVANKTDVNLPDPEVGFTHNWYTKGSDLRVKEFSVTQELDWTVLTGQRKRISRKKNELVDLQYIQERNSLRLRALQELIALVHATSWLEEMKTRESDAMALADAYQDMLEVGETNVIEANRARVNLVNVRADTKKAEADRIEILNRIKALNGGKSLEHLVSDYSDHVLPVDFESWCSEAVAVNPDLAYMRQATELSKQAVKQARTAYVPNLSVGYGTEQSPVEGKHALMVGLRIPLWQNRNKVKQSKMEAVAAESRETDARIQLIADMETCYERAKALRQVADACLLEQDHKEMIAALRQALSAGQINVLEYVTELGQYYDTREKALNAERDYQLVYATLSAYTWH